MSPTPGVISVGFHFLTTCNTPPDYLVLNWHKFLSSQSYPPPGEECTYCLRPWLPSSETRSRTLCLRSPVRFWSHSGQYLSMSMLSLLGRLPNISWPDQSRKIWLLPPFSQRCHDTDLIRLVRWVIPILGRGICYWTILKCEDTSLRQDSTLCITQERTTGLPLFEKTPW